MFSMAQHHTRYHKCAEKFLLINPFDTKPMAKIAVKNEHNEGGEVHVQLR